LETARRLAPHLTAITLDIVMPEMDGWQVLHALQEDPEVRNIPVILCSITDSLDEGLREGATAYLKKPVTRDEVLEVLESVDRRQ
jgi:CheY-like chemotaxis protein